MTSASAIPSTDRTLRLSSGDYRYGQVVCRDVKEERIACPYPLNEKSDPGGSLFCLVRHGLDIACAPALNRSLVCEGVKAGADRCTNFGIVIPAFYRVLRSSLAGSSARPLPTYSHSFSRFARGTSMGTGLPSSMISITASPMPSPGAVTTEPPIPPNGPSVRRTFSPARTMMPGRS